MALIYDLPVNNEELLPIDLSALFESKELFENDSCISLILHADHVVDMMEWLDVKQFEYYKAKTDSDYADFMLVSAFLENGKIEFIVESVHNEDCLKRHECEVLILPSYLPQELKKHYIKNCEHKLVIRLVDDSIANRVKKIIQN